ncbi:MAG TPA: protease inhibitor I9 family protein, partial [Thermoanaerobaculia bacterium]|nr:protease inhibitor I9 family protein [Thermoanaerobaculia bacterium]
MATDDAFAAGTAKVLRHRNPVQDSYIVVFDDSVANERVEPLARDLARRHHVQIERRGAAESIFRFALKGFGGRMTDAAAEGIAEEPGVAFVEQDAYVQT